MSEHTVAEYNVHIHGAGPPAADSDTGGLNVLRDFAALSEPLRPHVEAIRGLLAAAEPFDDADDVPEAKRRPIRAEMERILEAAGPEVQCYAVAVLVDSAGERAAAHERLLQLVWPAVERSAFPPLPETFKAELTE